MSTREQKAEYERIARERWEKVKRMGTKDKRAELELVSLTAEQEKQLAGHKKNLDLYFGGLQRSKAELLGYAFLIGNELNQAKDVLPHGQFEAFVEERYQLPASTQKRWREHAVCVIEKWAELTTGKKPTVGFLNPLGEQGKSATVALLKSPLDLAGKKKFTKQQQVAILEIIPEITERKGMVQFIQDCKLMREPKPAGGFRPDKQALETWLKEHHPELAGQEYDALPAEVQKAFRKDYKPRLDPWMIQEGHKAFWADIEQKLGRGLEEKTYVELDQEALERLRMLFVDAAHTLKAAQRKA